VTFDLTYIVPNVWRREANELEIALAAESQVTEEVLVRKENGELETNSVAKLFF
jgi:hypothetical protein